LQLKQSACFLVAGIATTLLLAACQQYGGNVNQPTPSASRWTPEDSAACRVSFRESFGAKTGLEPSSAMVEKYCNCAEVAINSGDSLSQAVALCQQSLQ